MAGNCLATPRVNSPQLVPVELIKDNVLKPLNASYISSMMDKSKAKASLLAHWEAQAILEGNSRRRGSLSGEGLSALAI